MKTVQLRKLSNLLLFTKETLRQLEEDSDRLDFNITYWLQKGHIIALKKGVYILKDTWEKEMDKDGYRAYIANHLCQPSYLSGEYVMGTFGLLTEAVYGITSATTHSTRSYRNNVGNFQYYSLSPSLFLGYEMQSVGRFSVAVATKSKALFDFLYLRFFKQVPVNEQAVEELRIHWEHLNRSDWKELQRFTRISKSVRIRTLMNIIIAKYAS